MKHSWILLSFIIYHLTLLTIVTTRPIKRACWLSLLLLLSFSEALAASRYETQYRRPVSEVMNDVARRFNVKFKFDSNVDTAGVSLPYADFRIRPYSLEQTLDNICKYFDWNWWKQSGNLYKIKLYEYPRRHEDEGRQMLDYLAAKYSNVQEWEQRRAILKKEVRERLEIDAFLDSCVKDAKPILELYVEALGKLGTAEGAKRARMYRAYLQEL